MAKNGGKRKSKKSKSQSNLSQNGSSASAPPSHVLVHLLAEPEFYEAVSALKRPFTVTDHEQDGKPGLFASVDGLEAFGEVLTWFAAGTEEDASAKLELLPDLSKERRASIHRLVVSKFQDKLETYSQGIGPERHITICRKGSAPTRQMTPEQEQQAAVLFALSREAGLTFSRDEISEALVEDKMPGDLASLWESAGKQHWAAQQLCQAAALGDIPALQALVAEKADVLKASVKEPQQGRLPLQCAATAGQAEALRVLHAAGADLEALDGSGMTPLQSARKAEQCDAEAALLQLGAVDPDADVMPVVTPAAAQDQPAASEATAAEPSSSAAVSAATAAEPEPAAGEPEIVAAEAQQPEPAAGEPEPAAVEAVPTEPEAPEAQQVAVVAAPEEVEVEPASRAAAQAEAPAAAAVEATPQAEAPAAAAVEANPRAEAPAAAAADLKAPSAVTQAVAAQEDAVPARKAATGGVGGMVEPMTEAIGKIGHSLGEVFSGVGGGVAPSQQISVWQVGSAVVAVVGGALLLRRWLRYK